MAYYNDYQTSQPTWGTAQYQSMPPPIPQYQPQPSWRGADYYRAHANATDNTLFDYVWSKVRNLVTGGGVGRNEAAYWWNRVYGGLVHPSKLLPREVGASAGYEAIRCWEHHNSIYVKPLSSNREREREGLIGLATAEAARLWAYTQRPLDKYGRMEASEVAASTAARIFTQSYDEAYERQPRGRRRSTASMRYDTNAFSDGDYLDDIDDDISARSHRIHAYPRHSHRHQKHHGGHARRSSSLYRRSPSPVGPGMLAIASTRYDTHALSDDDYLDDIDDDISARSHRIHAYPRHSHRHQKYHDGHARRSSSLYRRSPSPVSPGVLANAVGFSSAAVPPYATQYASGSPVYGVSPTAALGPGTYYPPTYQHGHSPFGAMAGSSPYMNRTYPGSSVGLPPPPTGQYLAAPTLTHRRSYSTGAYDAVRPSFSYY